MEGNSLEFTAIRGVQAGSAYYVIMVRAEGRASSLFKFDDEAIPTGAFERSGCLIQSRVPAIARTTSRNNPAEVYYFPSSLRFDRRRD